MKLNLLLPRLALASGAAIALAGCNGASNSNTASSTSEGSSSNMATNTATNASPAASEVASGGKTGPLKLAFVCNNTSDFWTIARKGTEKADAELANVSVEFVMPATSAPEDQTRRVNDLLSKGLDGMAISPVDPANQGDLLDKVAERALVFTQDSDAPDSKRACYIGTNNRDAGKQAGDLIKKSLPKGGKIMLFVGKRDAQNAADREAGIRDALKGSNISILDVRTDDVKPVRAKANAADALVKYPDLAACVGLWSYNGPAILGAVQDANKIGKVKIIAFDEEEGTLDGVESGAIAGTIVQQPYEFGYQSIKLMSKVLGGDKSGIPASKQIFVPTVIIDKSNLAPFRTKLKKLRA